MTAATPRNSDPSAKWSPGAWTHGAFDGYRDRLDCFGTHDAWPTLSQIEQQWLFRCAITSACGQPLRLLAQQEGAPRTRPRNRRDLYDVSVCAGQVPTRSCNWHDFFNVLMFSVFPHSKRLLHGLHCGILETRVPEVLRTLPGARTREQDHLAMLDEGGVLLVVDAGNAAALIRELAAAKHDTLSAAITGGRVRPWLFGHAHLEHLALRALCTNNEPLPRAKPVVLEAGVCATRDQVDNALAARLEEPGLAFLQHGWRAVSLDCLFGAFS